MRVQPRWALFISGQGSNMSTLLDQKQYAGSIALVVSSSTENFGLKRARRKGIPTLSLDKKIDWNKLTDQLHQLNITHIFLLGFMKIVPQSFLEKWTRPILNVHPSLLPSYPGLSALERAYQDQAPMGVTVHKVIPAVDAGEILLQKNINVNYTLKEGSISHWEQKIHELEYDLVRKSVKVAACWM